MNFFTSTGTEKFSLAECILRADDLGFRENFKVTYRGMVTPLTRYFYSPEETNVRHQFVMENPKDRRGYSGFYLLETAEGRRGFLIEEESDFSNALVTTFVSQIPGHAPLVPDFLMRPVSWLRSVQNLF